MQKFSGGNPLPTPHPLGAYGAEAQRDTPPKKILVTALDRNVEKISCSQQSP